MEQAFTLFSTAIGTCAIAWGAKGIIGLSLPSREPGAIGSGMVRRFPQVTEQLPPQGIASVIADIQALLQGEPRDLRDAALDFDGLPEFHQRVYDVARQIPPGLTLTYGQVTDRLKAPGASRAVGQALGANPFPIIVPCHRVLAAAGGAGGFSAPGGLETKLKILNIERVNAPAGENLFGNLPLVVPPRRSRGVTGARRR